MRKEADSMPTVDSLDIQISAQATKASASLDKLTEKLDTLSASLNKVSVAIFPIFPVQRKHFLTE